MEWQKDYELGHDKIDLEHRVFFDLVKSVGSALDRGDSKDRIRRLIAETAKYADFHFLSEENIMIDVGYPDFADHHKIHQELMQSLNRCIVNFEVSEESTRDLVTFLTNWFVKHTTNEDLKVAKYIKQQ